MAKKSIVQKIDEVKNSTGYVPEWLGSQYVPLILIPLDKAKLLKKKIPEVEEAYEDQYQTRPSAAGIADDYLDVA